MTIHLVTATWDKTAVILVTTTAASFYLKFYNHMWLFKKKKIYCKCTVTKIFFFLQCGEKLYSLTLF